MPRTPLKTLSALTLVASCYNAPAPAADAALIEAAKREGSVTWYTTSIIDQFVRPAAQAFEKKYGIKVAYARSNAVEMELRVINEARAGRMQADLVDGTTTSVVLKQQNLVEKWTPAVELPERYRDPEGYWMASQEYVLTPGYNTDLVPKGSEPQSWEDLLAPRFKGRMAWNSTPSASAGQGFVGIVLLEYGEARAREYFAKLARQDITAIKSAARQVLDQAISGEYDIALQIFNNHTTISRRRGAPVSWLKLQPALAVVLPMSLLKGAPHPNAGKLLFDFILSEEGQNIMAQAGELPVLPGVPPLDADLRPGPGNYRALYIAPEKLVQSVAGWTRIYNEYFN